MQAGLNPAVEGMPRSGIRLVLDEANKLGGVLHLEIGQPDLATPAHVVEAAAEAARAGFTGYTPNAGLSSLREAFAQRLAADHSVSVSPEQVVVTVGAMGGLFSALCAVIEPGDEVLVPDPGYPNYAMAAQLIRGVPVRYRLDASTGFGLQLGALEAQVGPRTKAVVINTPSNPTGSVLDADQIRAVTEWAQRLGLYLISDEAYDHICFEGYHRTPLALGTDDRIVAVYSCSKTYSMTGWRVGFAVSSPKMAGVLAKLQEVYVACASSVSQKAAEAALTGPQDCVARMMETYRQRRSLALHVCNTLGFEAVPPKGAFYLMLRLPPKWADDSTGYALELLMAERVAVAPGQAFGPAGEGYVRLALCAQERTIEQGLQGMNRFNMG